MSIIGVIMLMGLVAKNAILLLDAARAEEREGMDREEALMHAGRKRLRPIMMTTFALIAGMMPVAIGLGEGGEFYRPMAVTIIGGTITSTMLTLLVIPCFYDSIEMMRERCVQKFHRRSERFTAGRRLRADAARVPRVPHRRCASSTAPAAARSACPPAACGARTTASGGAGASPASQPALNRLRTPRR